MEFRKKTKFNKYMLFGLVLVMSYVDCSMFYYGNNETLKNVSLAGIDETEYAMMALSHYIIGRSRRLGPIDG